MTNADRRLKTLGNRIADTLVGKTKIIVCPYCNKSLDFSPPAFVRLDSFEQNYEPPTCCAEFALGVIAILQRIEQTEMKEIAEQIQANVGGPKAFVN